MGRELDVAVIMPVEIADRPESRDPESHIQLTVVTMGEPPADDDTIVPVMTPAVTVACIRVPAGRLAVWSPGTVNCVVLAYVRDRP